MSGTQAQHGSRFEKGWGGGYTLSKGRGRALLQAWIAVAGAAWGLTAASAFAQTPAAPTTFGLPSAAAENMAGRTEASKEFSLPDGTAAQILFTRPIHYRDDSGQWQDVDLGFHDDGEGGQIMDRHPGLRVHLPGQSGAIEVTDTDGNGVRFLASPAMRIEGRQAHYEDAQGITWTYTTTAAGVKHHAIVTRSRGPRTYRFGYQLLGEQPAFTVDEDGNAVSGTWEVPRATIDDANGIHHLAGPWRVQGRVLAFDFDDTGIPTPYTIDPSIQPKAAANDWGATSWADTWDDARGGTPGSSTLTYVSSASSMAIGDEYASGAQHPYSVSRYFVAFDTSQLRTSDSIVGVYLYMAIQLDQSTTDFTVKIREYDWVTPNNTDQYRTEWQKCLTANDPSSQGYDANKDHTWRNTNGLVAYPTPPPDWDPSSDSLVRVSSDYLKRSGKTRYCLVSDRDLNDTTPTNAEYINAYSAASDGYPSLLVIYDPATPTPTRTRSFTPTVTNTPTITRTPTITNTPVPGAGTPTYTPTRTRTPTPTPPCDPSGMCPTSSCTIATSATVRAGCHLDWSGKSVTINSGVVIQDPDGGSGFSIEAVSLTVNGTLKARGGALAITTTGAFQMGVPTSGAGTIDVKDGGSVAIAAGGDCTLNGTTITADGLTVPMKGGTISVTCPNVIGTGALSANGAGDAATRGDGGSIMVATNSDAGEVVLSGTIDANSAGPVGFGGFVSLDAAAQLTTGKTINAKGTSGGVGGSVFVTAGGPAVIDGAAVLTATAGGGVEGDGGWIFVQADSILVAAGLDASGSSTYGGIGGDIDLLSGSGPITVLCTGSLSASGGGAGAWGGWIWVDSGAGVDLTECTASGNDSGGWVDISAQGTVNISGNVTVTSSGTDSSAGDITVAADGDINTAPGTALNAYSSGSGGSDGTITLEGCNLNLAGNIDSKYGSHSGGANTVKYHGQLIAISTVVMETDTGSTNRIVCPCVKDSNGSCTTACINEPIFLGSSTPAYTLSRQDISRCD